MLTFPPRRDDLLATLLAHSLQMLPDDQAAAMAEEVGFDYGRALAGKMGPTEGHRSMRTAVNAVADALTAHGFAAHAEADGESLQIISQQCPFGEAAQQFPHVVCAVDRGMIRGMLAGLYGETQPALLGDPPGGRRQLHHLRLALMPPPGLSRPRLLVAAAARGLRGDAAVDRPSR